jgi:hypothetical protein
VYQFSVPAILMTAIELVRPEHFHLIVLVVVLPLLVLEAGIRLARRVTARRSTRWYARVLGWRGLDSPMVTGVLRAMVLLLTAYSLGSHLGYVTFTRHVVNTFDNSLPAVSVLVEGKDAESAAALACGAQPGSGVVIGDKTRLRQIQATYQTCTGRDTTWRLLYRDRDIVVVFASQRADRSAGSRPLTVVLPATSSIRLMTQ